MGIIRPKAAKLGAEIAANRKKATTAIHAGLQRQSRRAFLMGQASDPILAMCSAPHGAPVNPLRFTNTGKS